jgi:hypothetical protein
VNTGNGSALAARQRAAPEVLTVGCRKCVLDAVGHYSRPDVFQLIVNERPLAAVVAKG